MNNDLDMSKLEPSDTCAPAQKEEEAIQQMRDLLGEKKGSPEFENFAAGMKKAMSVPKADYKAHSKEKRS